jgi:CD63 antigen
VGAVIEGFYHNYSFILDEKFFSAPALLIAVGVIVLIVSFFGCCGAVRENHCMILTVSDCNS